MSAADDRARLKPISFKSVGKGGLAGFASVEFLDIGLRLLDVPVFASGQNGPWAGLPRKPLLDRDHRQQIDANRKLAFEAIAVWADRAASSRFSDAVVALIRAKHPGVFSEVQP